ncbi:hypothetical protein D1872_323570 [compost metagenome]
MPDKSYTEFKGSFFTLMVFTATESLTLSLSAAAFSPPVPEEHAVMDSVNKAAAKRYAQRPFIRLFSSSV